MNNNRQSEAVGGCPWPVETACPRLHVKAGLKATPWGLALTWRRQAVSLFWGAATPGWASKKRKLSKRIKMDSGKTKNCLLALDTNRLNSVAWQTLL